MIPPPFLTSQQSQYLHHVNLTQRYGNMYDQIPQTNNYFGSQSSDPNQNVHQEVASPTPVPDKGQTKAKRSYTKRKTKETHGQSSVDKIVATGKIWKAADYKVLVNAWVNASVVPEGRSGGKFFYL